MASDDTYRDYYFMSRRRNLLDKLNKIDAPPMSTVFNIVKTKGTEDKRQAELLLKTAIDSIQIMDCFRGRDSILSLLINTS